MSEVDSQIPEQWTNSAVVRHLDNPYSDSALAEPRKDWIDLGQVDLTKVANEFTESPNSYVVSKVPGEDFDIAREPDSHQELHRTFFEAAKRILGYRSFIDSSVYFEHHTDKLRQGYSHTFTEPHLDGIFPGTVNAGGMAALGLGGKDELKLFGTVANIHPAVTLQGAIARSDFCSDDDNFSTLRPSSASRLQAKPIPLNHLVIMAPSTPHMGPVAQSYEGARHFLRWQLYSAEDN